MTGKVQNARVHRDHATVCVCCHGAHAAALFRKGGGHLCRHAAAALGHPLGHHAVIRAEDQQAAVVDAHIGAALHGGKPCDHILQQAETAEGLGEAVPLCLCLRPCRLVRRGDLFNYVIDAFHRSHAFTKRSARGAAPPKCRCGNAAYRLCEAYPQRHVLPSAFAASRSSPFSVESQ